MSKIKRNGQSQTIPLFIQKLCNILEDENCTQYIQWVSTGDAFNIKDINKFTDIVLPKYFKHNNFSSFIRQLNMYGFSKIRHDEGENVYTNQNFKRGEKNLISNIKRKINQTQKDDQVAVYNPPNNINKQINDLKGRQRNLQSMCKQLIDQNNKILQQNNLMMKKLNTQHRQKNNKMQQLLVSLIMARGNNQLTLPSSQQPRMLSLTNQTKPDYGNNLQSFRQFLEDSNGISRLQEALKVFQSEQKKRNKSKNYTIVNQHQKEQNAIKSMPQQLKLEENGNGLKKQQKINSQDHGDHDNSMLSLGDFLNLDQNQRIDLNETPL